MPSGAYWIAKTGDRPVGGMFLMQGPEFGDIPDHWFAHIAVDDVDARVSRVQAAGGAVLRAPFDVPGVGRIAVVKDATGAAVGWITPAPEMAGRAAERHSAAVSAGSTAAASALPGRSVRSPIRADLPRRDRR